MKKLFESNLHSKQRVFFFYG